MSNVRLATASVDRMMVAMRFFNRHRQGNDTEAGALSVLDSSNVYKFMSQDHSVLFLSKLINYYKMGNVTAMQSSNACMLLLQ